ncbi:hypothetical protein [Halosimplex carlsbadense]|nr:hypothetical protein [Halosimplex carlsbadense]
MPSETDALLRSIRRWLILATFAIGVGVVAIADAGYIVSNYQDELVFAVGGVAGGAVALLAGLTLLSDLGSGGDRPEPSE